jgi:glycosyltransferase involved in cell wall biosynthesis
MVLLSDIRYDGRARKEIKTLVKAGHQVELIVSDYSGTGIPDEDLKINIHYIPMRLWSRASINFFEQFLFNQKAASIIKAINPTHIHCHDLNTLSSGIWAKEKTKAKLTFDAHELYPESLGGVKGSVWNYIERIGVKRCDYIVIPEKNRIKYFKRKYSNIPEPFLLQNFPRKADILTENIDIFRKTLPIDKKQKIILHTGTMHPRRHIEELIDSMPLCNEEFVLILLGGLRKTYAQYKELLHKKIHNLGLSGRVFLLNSVPHVDIIRYMASADIGTAFYSNININNYYCASNKLYEFIALEKPILTNNYPGLLENVERFRLGVCLSEVTPKSLAKAYIDAHNPELVNLGAKKFFWEDEEYVLLQLYDE